MVLSPLFTTIKTLGMAFLTSATFLLLLFLLLSISSFTSTVHLNQLLDLNLNGELSMDQTEVQMASIDFGGMSQVEPLAVFHPGSVTDIASLVKSAYDSAEGRGFRFTVSARGHGHSISGQAQTSKGVVIDMSGSTKANQFRDNKPGLINQEEMYVDVWGGALWIDVLNWSLEYGLAPKSWTDYLYLSVGGTLSNAGISGQAFNHGPQISNVFELDVVTGKGEVMTCSKEKNSELFHGVLGGLGQFGIITRARIGLEKAPQRVRWIRVLYSDFSVFTSDQEFLISLHAKPTRDKFDYVEGFVIVEEGLVNNWRSSFFSPSNPVKISSLNTGEGVLYCLEVTKNYHDSTTDTIDQEVEALLKKLNFIPSTIFTTDLPYIDFLDRVHKAELKLRSKGLWDVPHPWLNLFVPKSKIAEFDRGIFKGILGNKTSGPILIYPMNREKWNHQSSVVIPEEDTFYLVGFLRSALDTGEITQTLDHLKNQNSQIIEFCDEAGLDVKQYLPHYTTEDEWKNHFGQKWNLILKRKMEFDPRSILATGQSIFKPALEVVVDSEAKQ